MRMYEAARVVLDEAGGPMNVRQIHQEIVSRGLFEFGAKNPVAVLSQSLRERCKGGRKANPPIFTRVGPGVYGLAK